MRLFLCVFTALCALPACSDGPLDADGDGIFDGPHEPTNVIVTAPTAPKGYVAGYVADYLSGRPLEATTVRAYGGGIDATSTTAADGYFDIGPLSAGAALRVTITAEGYFQAEQNTLTIPAAAGTSPTDNGGLFIGPIRLLRNDGTFTTRILSDAGTPVADASIRLEGVTGHFENRFHSTSLRFETRTDAEGIARFGGLPNYAALPIDVDEGLRQITLLIDAPGFPRHVEAVDLPAGVAAPHLIILGATAPQSLAVRASNIRTLLDANADPSVLAADAPIRLVFNQPVDPARLRLETLDENGEDGPELGITSQIENQIFAFSHDTTFVRGRAYYLILRAETSAGAELSAETVFFTERPDDRIRVSGEYEDTDDTGTWGTAADTLRITFSTPFGRPSANPAFSARIYFDLDLNGSGEVGDATGELPRLGDEYPDPIRFSGAELDLGLGLARTGFTRFGAAIPLPTSTPLGPEDGPLLYEIQILPEDQVGGDAATTPDGTPIPNRFDGAAALITR